MYYLCIIFTVFYHSTVSCSVFILYQNTATFFGTNTFNATINKNNFTEFCSVNHVARPSRRQKSLWELFIWHLRVLFWWKESVLTRQNVVLSAVFFNLARYMRGLDKMSTVLFHVSRNWSVVSGNVFNNWEKTLKCHITPTKWLQWKHVSSD